MDIHNHIGCRPIPRQFGAALAVLLLTCLGEIASAAQALPDDAEGGCRFESAELAGWFEAGAVTLNGAAKPADSLNFSDNSHCDFHKWAARMFLWLTSPASGGGMTFQSRDFYAVSPPANGKRTLTPNDPGKTDNFLTLRTSKMLETGMPGMGHGVLMAQTRSLVYDGSFVNDVFAYFLTGAKTGRFNFNRFPIFASDLNQISALAMQQDGITFPHPETLALEVKATWVNITGLGAAGLDPNKYIRMTAMIPDYHTSDPTEQRWTRKSKPAKAELALVGMHVVGSAFGNSDMIWATFEHVDNTPIGSYAYKSTSGGRIDVPPSTGGPWLFSRSNPGPFNEMRMHARNAPDIQAEAGKTIAPSDTRRDVPWGSSTNDPAHNARVIEINRGTMGMLASDDVRRNYLLIGSTWHLGVGSNQLANTTMETYEQTKNCFRCHHGDFPDGTSIMYKAIQPLFP